MDYVRAIEKSLGKKAIKEIKPMQPGDVVATSSDTSKLEDWVQFKPKTPIDVGVNKFINWYKKYYDYDF